ncbi:hypothetical protein [Paracoccus litorisediminis]|uniref:Lipoprotein n=1 Tax=Paracoccus litorisediminis TaxID=2006130 RepID=A0A844HUG9_9RHOB|nr:hypothetical protein [Paracoccus litorisediminis]MTH61152.1 hypothetical protein [Paracoccus litorisediminis]
MALTALVGACAGSGITGAGTGEDGAPMTARMTVFKQGGVNTITMTSAKGVTCTGDIDLGAYLKSKQPSREIPITCNNGDKGVGIYTNSNYQLQSFTPGKTQLAYRLESGAKGTISF